MNIFLTDEEMIEISPISPSDDKGKVIPPRIEVPQRQEVSDIRKEITAVDSIENTTREAALINGVSQSAAARYSNGMDMSPDSRAKIISLRNNIQDVAVAKLMDTLNLINPHNVEKERDRVAIMTGLSSVIEKLNPGGSSKDGDKPTVHLHLYSPNQKAEKDYDIIDA